MFLHFLFRDQYAAHIPRIFTWITQTRFYLLFLYNFPSPSVIIGMVLLPCCQLGMCIRRANLWPACCMTCPAYLRWSFNCMAESWRKIFWGKPQLCNTVAHHTRAAIKPRKMSSINSTHSFFSWNLKSDALVSLAHLLREKGHYGIWIRYCRCVCFGKLIPAIARGIGDCCTVVSIVWRNDIYIHILDLFFLT